MVVWTEIRHLLLSAPSVLKVSLRSKWLPFLTILHPNFDTTLSLRLRILLPAPCTRLEVPTVENLELKPPFGLTISPWRGLRWVKFFDSITVIAQSHLYIVLLRLLFIFLSPDRMLHNVTVPSLPPHPQHKLSFTIKPRR